MFYFVYLSKATDDPEGSPSFSFTTEPNRIEGGSVIFTTSDPNLAFQVCSVLNGIDGSEKIFQEEEVFIRYQTTIGFQIGVFFAFLASSVLGGLIVALFMK